MHLGGRPVETDLTAVAWYAESVRDRPQATVSSFVPPVFEAYARVFHPAVRYRDLDDEDVSWAEVAGANGTVAHPLMQWGSITGSMDYFTEDNQSPLWDDSPAQGHLPEHLAVTMAAVLRRHTGIPDDCWFGLETGWLSEPVQELALPNRAFCFVRGPVEFAAVNLLPEPTVQSANLWLPADRAWVVSTDIDLATTYVGGSATAIADLLAAAAIEAWPASSDDPVGFDADTVNPPPER